MTIRGHFPYNKSPGFTRSRSGARDPIAREEERQDMEATHKEKFEEGLGHLKEGRPEEAFDLLKEASEADPGNPWYRSYYGLCLGYLKRFAEAEKQCQTAIDQHMAKAQFYVNLGEVYLLGARRKQAHEMFKEALKWEKENPMAKKYLAQMGLRKKPVLPFLDRTHPVNVSLGKLRHKLSKPLQPGRERRETGP